jgi:sporulation protein YlmC with PRC-barrel domain
MKTIGTKTTAWLVAVMALACAWNARCDQSATSPDSSTSGTASGYQNNQTATDQGAPQKYNRAGGLIGMDVENQNGEHLGRIKDIVFDLKSDRVSYVVMTTAPKVTLGIDEKLLAVPLSAFTISSDNRQLVLNADKAKIEAATGFNKDNWPDVGNPSWGAQPFWQQNGTENKNPNQSDVNPNRQNNSSQPDSDIGSPGAGYRGGVQDYPPPARQPN